MQRTAVYIDGFNLWYGELRGSRHAWLDLEAFSRAIAPKRCQVTQVKYFTARKDGPAGIRQDIYLQALEAHCEHLHVTFGQFQRHEQRALLADRSGTVTVLRTEEKGTDVNLAVHLVDDAARGKIDAALVVSNDSDLVEGVRLAQGHGVAVGVAAPLGHSRPGRRRYLSKELREQATFLRSIRGSALRKSQLPSPVPGTGLRRPQEWL